jgi:hypothetical protein
LPQHYSQQLQHHFSTYSINFGNHVVFVWHHDRFKATMPLTSVTNVGILRSMPGHKVFASFVQMGDDESPTHFSSTLITDDKADAFESDADDKATLSSTASLEGDDEDGVNTTSTPSTLPANTKETAPSAPPEESEE